jgi:hypothetical protein
VRKTLTASICALAMLACSPAAPVDPPAAPPDTSPPSAPLDLTCNLQAWSGDLDSAFADPVRVTVFPGAVATVDGLAETPPVHLRNLGSYPSPVATIEGCALYCPTQPGGCTVACPCEPVLAEEPPGCTCVRLEPIC